MSSSTKELLAAKRAEARNAPAARAQPIRQASGNRAGWGGGEQLVEERTVQDQVRKASRSGKLDISSFHLTRVPAEVYTDLLCIPAEQLSNPPGPPTASTDHAGGGRNGNVDTMTRDQAFNQRPRAPPAADPEELTAWKASDNEIRELDIEIGMFGGLLSLDLRNNQLSSLPNSFADLLRLQTLDLSHNQFIDLPSAIQYLPKLDLLNMSYNRISTIDLTKPIEASAEGKAYGAGFLSTSFSRKGKKDLPGLFMSLRSFNLGHNELTNEALKGMVHLDVWPCMRFLNLEHNRLDGVLDLREVGIEWRTMKIEKLTLSGNPNLRDITVGHLPAETVIEMEGCNQPRRGGASTAGGAATTNAPATGQAAAPAGPTLPSPPPTTTIIYKTAPAATFNSLPLDIDFDLWLPPTPATGKGHALVIWFHGGGLLQGNKENLPPHFRRLPEHEFQGPNGPESIAVISPNYRLAPQVPIIDILGDMTALLVYVRTKLNDRLAKDGRGEHKIDTSRICLSGGSAGGYLALMGGLRMPPRTDIEEVGGYLGEEGIKCIAPFYPITDLTDSFWATEVNPVPWQSRSISHEEAAPHINTKIPPICTAVSGGPRSVLYSYMLQHGLFPGLLFQAQRNVGTGNLAFRPTPESLSIPHRLDVMRQFRATKQPVYFAHGTADTAVQKMDKTLEALRNVEGELVEEKREGVDHAYDEDANEECLEFREWLGKTLL